MDRLSETKQFGLGVGELSPRGLSCEITRLRPSDCEKAWRQPGWVWTGNGTSAGPAGGRRLLQPLEEGLASAQRGEGRAERPTKTFGGHDSVTNPKMRFILAGTYEKLGMFRDHIDGSI